MLLAMRRPRPPERAPDAAHQAEGDPQAVAAAGGGKHDLAEGGGPVRPLRGCGPRRVDGQDDEIAFRVATPHLALRGTAVGEADLRGAVSQVVGVGEHQAIGQHDARASPIAPNGHRGGAGALGHRGGRRLQLLECGHPALLCFQTRVTSKLQVTLPPAPPAAGHDAGMEATPLDRALARVGDRWTLLVVEALLDGPRRYGELSTAVAGIAPNILAARLRKLEQEGLVVSTPYSSRPLRHQYQLTADGRELAGALHVLASWAARIDALAGRGPLPRDVRHTARAAGLVPDVRPRGRRRRRRRPRPLLTSKRPPGGPPSFSRSCRRTAREHARILDVNEPGDRVRGRARVARPGS